MAVQKSKRYRQITRSRRKKQIESSLLKKNILINKYHNYYNYFLHSSKYCEHCYEILNIFNYYCHKCHWHIFSTWTILNKVHKKDIYDRGFTHYGIDLRDLY